METTTEALAPYTVQQIEEIAVREAAKMISSLQRYETRYHRIEEHLEDLAGAWVLGAMVASKSIDPAKGSGRGYQFASGRGEMLDRLNGIKEELSSEDVSIHETIGGGEEGEEVALLDTIADPKAIDPAAMVEEAGNRKEAADLLALLNERQRAVMVARFVEGKQQQQVAAEMGLTAGRVSQIESESREIMRGAWAA